MRARLVLLGMLLLVVSWLPAQNLQVVPAGGFYIHAPQVTMTCPDTSLRIFFTTDGQPPTTADRPYTHPLTLTSSLFSDAALYQVPMCPPSNLYVPDDGVQQVVVLRAAAFNSIGQRVGKVVTNTYLVQDLGCDSHGLPVVSLCASHRDIIDDTVGILVPGVWYNGDDRSGNYYQEGREWERVVNMELYLPDGQLLNQQCGLRTHGGSARRYVQKGLKVYAREEYGDKRFRARIFEDTDVDAFKRLVLKPFACAWTHAGVQNMVTEQIARNLRLDVPAIRPAVLYLNGEYWGIYFLQEKPDERFLEDHYGGNDAYYNIIANWGWEVENGSGANFDALMEWLETADLRYEEDYRQIQQWVDLDNFIDYQIIELFSCNEDWPANNVRLWQYGNGRWRMLFFDGDAAMKHLDWPSFGNALYDGDEEYPASRLSTFLFRKLMENPSFQKRFSDRYNNLCNSILSYSQTKPYLESATSAIWAEVPLQVERFQFPASFQSWYDAVVGLDNFLCNRPWQAIQEMLEYIQLGESVASVSLYPNPSCGEVTVCVTVDEPGICGLYIYDMVGRMVYSNLLYCEEGTTQFFRQLPLPAGTYVVRVGGERVKLLIVN